MPAGGRRDDGDDDEEDEDEDDEDALTVEAEVACRGDEECLQEVALCQRVDLPRDVQGPPGHRDGATKAKQPVQVEGGDLGVVSLEVREVEVVGQRLLAAREPHRLEQGLRSISLNISKHRFFHQPVLHPRTR